ncbi:MAG: hypothetical protein ABL858_07350, partial [Candidatus Nitrotoga sp.]
TAHRPPPTAYRIPHTAFQSPSALSSTIPQFSNPRTLAGSDYAWHQGWPGIKVVRVGSKLFTLHATMFAPQKLLPYPAQIGLNPFVQHTRNLAITASSNPHNNFSMN